MKQWTTSYPLVSAPPRRPPPIVNIEPTGVSVAYQPPAPEEISSKETIDRLVKLVESISAPDMWCDKGGTDSITELGGKLYVVQTLVVQAKVAEVIADATGDITLSTQKGEVIVDVLKDVTAGESPTTRPAGDAPEAQQFHTTARIPLGEDAIIGGMTAEAGENGKPSRALYLVLRVDAD